MISDFNYFSAYFRSINVVNYSYGKVSQGKMKMKRFSLFDSHFLLRTPSNFPLKNLDQRNEMFNEFSCKKESKADSFSLLQFFA